MTASGTVRYIMVPLYGHQRPDKALNAMRERGLVLAAAELEVFLVDRGLLDSYIQINWNDHTPRATGYGSPWVTIRPDSGGVLYLDWLVDAAGWREAVAPGRLTTKVIR